MAEYTFLPEAANDKIGFVIKTIEKEARKEYVLIRQVLYVMLSMYSNDPRNLMVNAPSGEGKTYTIRKVADLFPKEDVIKFIGMSEKSLFHKQGKAVIRNDETGEYEPLDQIIERIDSDIADANANGDKQKVRELQREKNGLGKNAKNLIDLSNKCIILLDTPPQSLLNALIPLMSHDGWEVEYDFVDTHNGIKTKSNVLRGWPVIISTQAIELLKLYQISGA